ncbi:MAG: ceramide glucosyltransferase, partial [Methylocystis sp.]|nr:ceramide glucosyltransferase [Methylocystis sp.]
MTALALLGWVAAVYWIIAVALLVASVAATIAQPWLAARRATRRDQPAVSI